MQASLINGKLRFDLSQTETDEVKALVCPPIIITPTQLPAPANYRFDRVGAYLLKVEYDAVQGATKYQIEVSRAN